MTNLSILNQSIRTFENLFSLTDLHKASGAENKHKPTFFLRLDQTKDLIAEIEVNSELQICNSVKVIHGGPNSGTYACEELVLAYATWISPKFHLIVLRAFLAMHKNEPKQLALPTSENTTITQEQQQKIQSAVQQAHHRTGLHFQEIYRQLKAQFSVAKYDQLPQGDFEQAIFFINNLKPTTSGRSIPYHENKLELDERQTLPMFYYVSEVLKAAKELETFAKHFKYKKEHALCEIALSTHQILTNSALKRRVESMLFEIADKMQYSSDKKFYGDLIVNP